MLFQSNCKFNENLTEENFNFILEFIFDEIDLATLKLKVGNFDNIDKYRDNLENSLTREFGNEPIKNIRFNFWDVRKLGLNSASILGLGFLPIGSFGNMEYTKDVMDYLVKYAQTFLTSLKSHYFDFILYLTIEPENKNGLKVSNDIYKIYQKHFPENMDPFDLFKLISLNQRFLKKQLDKSIFIKDLEKFKAVIYNNFYSYSGESLDITSIYYSKVLE